MHTMLCFKFCRSALPCTISGGLLPPTAAVSRPFRSVSQSCRSVTAKQYLPQRLLLLWNQVQGQGAQINMQKATCHRFGPSESTPLLSRLAPPRILPFSSYHQRLKPPIRRSHATAHDASAIFLQPLDPSCRRQSIKRGFAISLPILTIYVLLYLLNLVPQESELGRRYMSTVARFWTYRRHEGFQNIFSLGTFITSQFTHDRLIRLMIDSVVLVGVASVLGSVFSCRTFFAVYVFGGFLAAAADCAWARLTSPYWSVTQAQLDQTLASIRLFAEAQTKINEFDTLSLLTMRGKKEILTKKGDVVEVKEVLRLVEIMYNNRPTVISWIRWTRPNWAASGSLVCLSMPPIRWVTSPFVWEKNRIHSDADVE